MEGVENISNPPNHIALHLCDVLEIVVNNNNNKPPSGVQIKIKQLSTVSAKDNIVLSSIFPEVGGAGILNHKNFLHTLFQIISSFSFELSKRPAGFLDVTCHRLGPQHTMFI